MVKMDLSHLKYLDRSHFRILTSIEMGMKNHEYVPTPLIYAISGINKRRAAQALVELLRLRLIDRLGEKNYEGYRLTFDGYDYLALKTLNNQNVVFEVGNKIGIGKESDIHIARDFDKNIIVIKLHRLGRTSFRKVKEKRDYLEHRNSASWLYFSRLSAAKEFKFMTALDKSGFPVPKPIATNRHCVVMSYIPGIILDKIKELNNLSGSYEFLRSQLIRMAENGLIHCDFNEFNLMIDNNEKIYVIDFPQMVSVNHVDSNAYFQRDLDCVKRFFERRFGFKVEDELNLDDISRTHDLDIQVKASGYRHDKNLNIISDDDELSENHSDSHKSTDPDNENNDIDTKDINILADELKTIDIHDIAPEFIEKPISKKVTEYLQKEEYKEKCKNAVKASIKNKLSSKSRDKSVTFDY